MRKEKAKIKYISIELEKLINREMEETNTTFIKASQLVANKLKNG